MRKQQYLGLSIKSCSADFLTKEGNGEESMIENTEKNFRGKKQEKPQKKI